MKPNFGKVSQRQEKALRDQLLAARELITHGPEKGRSLEGEVAAVVRAMLPAEYGVGTGFVAYHDEDGPKLSSQLDVIIFDAVKGNPLARLATCEVYPIESVFAYIEVKATLKVAGRNVAKPGPGTLQSCMLQNNSLRKMKTRMYWLPQSGSPPRDMLVPYEALSLRGFVFAFEAKGDVANDANHLAQKMSDAAKKYEAHLHGVLILDQVYLTTRAIDVNTAQPADYYHVSYTTQNAFAAFRLHFLRALSTFSRPPDGLIPAIDTYYEQDRSWKKVSPTTV
jgi:hypothetical protein